MIAKRNWALKEMQRPTLAGLKGVWVLVEVEQAHQDVKKHGLTDQQIQTDVELQLKQHDIKVLSEEQWQKTPGSPCLCVYLNHIATETGLCADSIKVSLRQDVVLLRDPQKPSWAATWETGSVGLTGEEHFGEGVRKDLEKRIDEFINAYLAANPKEQVAKKDSIEEQQ